MAFTDTEKVAIRRYCGYSVIGANPVQGFGYRYAKQFGFLEFLMNNLAVPEEDVVRNTYLDNLVTLENAILTASDNLDTDQAAVWYHNKYEQRDRERLYDSWRKKLCAFMGIDPGPGLGTGLRIVV